MDQKTIIIAAVAVLVIAAGGAGFLLMQDPDEPATADIRCEGHGTAAPIGVHEIGDGIDLTVMPDEGYAAELYVNGHPTPLEGSVYRIQPSSSNVDVLVRFVPASPGIEHTLTVERAAGGFCDHYGTASFPVDSVQRVMFLPADGYVLDRLVLDGRSLGASNVIEVSMDADHTLRPVFRQCDPQKDLRVDVDIQLEAEIITFSMLRSAETGYGTVTPSSGLWVAPGTDLVVTAELNEGFELQDLTVNGVSKGRVSEYRIEGIDAPVSISVKIVQRIIGFQVEVAASEGGTVSPSGVQKIIPGTDLVLTLTPAQDHRISHVLLDGETAVPVVEGRCVISNIQADHTVRAVFSSVTELSMESMPSKTEYIVGQSLDTAGMRVTALYDDGYRETVTGYKVAPARFDLPGTAHVTLTYMGKTIGFDVTVKNKVPVSMAVTHMPDRTQYIEGQTFDPAGMRVTATYNDGSVSDVTGYSIENGTFAHPGKCTVVIRMGSLSVPLTFDVDERVPVSAAVTHMPDRIQYVVGQTFDAKGMEVTVTFNDGTDEVSAAYEVSPGEFLQAGDVKVTVTLKADASVGCDLTVRVVPRLAVSVEITQVPSKTQYVVGQYFDPAGMVVTAVYNDGTSAAVTDYTVSSVPFSTPGRYDLRVVYGGQEDTVSVTVEARAVTEIQLVRGPVKIQYIAGQAFDPEGIAVDAVYNDGTVEHVLDYETENITFTEAGTPSVKVSYAGKTIDIQVTVLERKAVSMDIVAQPSKTDYVVGQSFDPAGMRVTVSYNDGTSEDADGYTAVPGRFDTAGPQTVTVSYAGFEKQVHVDVVPLEAESLEVTGQCRTEYVIGQTFDVSGLTVKVLFNDGSELLLLPSNYQVSPKFFDRTGPVDVRISYTFNSREVFDTVSVSVSDRSPVSIQVTKSPARTQYVVGQSFDPAGMELTVKYDNGIIEPLDPGRCTFVPGTFTSAGSKAVTVVFNTDLKATVPVTVEERKAVSISVTKEADRVSYIIGQTFDPTGMEVTVHFNDGTDEPASGFVCPFPELNEISDSFSILVSWKGLETETSVKVVDRSVVSLTLSGTFRTEYIAGDSFDPSGMTVTADYDNGTHETVGTYTVSPDVLKAADTRVSITYCGVSAYADITVRDVFTVSIVCPEGGTVSMSGNVLPSDKDVPAVEGTPISLNGNRLVLGGTEYVAESDADHRFDGWLLTPQNGGTVMWSISAVPVFTPLYDVTAADSAGGSIVADPVRGSEGTVITVTPSPDTGYRIKSMSYRGTGEAVVIEPVSGVYSFALPGEDVTVTAVFEKIVYTVSAGSADKGTVVLDSSTACMGDTVTFSISPDTGYHITWVKVNGTEIEGTDGSYSFVMPAENAVITAGFEKTVYTVTKGTASNGSFAVRGTATYGDAVIVSEILPDSGYQVDSVSYTIGTDTVAVPLKDGTYSFSMPAGDITVDVSFKKIQYTITCAEDANGTVTAPGSAVFGTEVTVTVAPAAGYFFESVYWKSAGTVHTIDASEGVYSFVMPKGDVEVGAVFTKITLTSLTVQNSAPDRVYYVGDEFDASDLKVTAVFNNGTAADLTSGFVCDHGVFTVSGEPKVTVTVSYTVDGVTCSDTADVIVKHRLVSIAVTKGPTMTQYVTGQKFNPAGMTVTATYDDGKTADVTASCTFGPDHFSDILAAAAVTVTYTEDSVTRTCTLEVAVGDSDTLTTEVVRHYGTNSDGTMFDRAPGCSMSEFAFDVKGLVPGAFQTVQVSVNNDSGYALEVYLCMFGLTGDTALADQMVLSVTHDGKTVSKSISEWNGQNHCICTLAAGTAAEFSMTLELPDRPDNNSVMGMSIVFTADLKGMEPVGGARQ